MRAIVYVLTFLMISSVLPLGIIQNSEASIVESSLSINTGDYQSISIGIIDSGKELEIEYSVNENIDVLLMTSSQYSSWQNGGVNHIESGSDYDDDDDDYVFTIENTDSYYVIFDNSNQAGSASATGNTVTGTSKISVIDPSSSKVRTRAWTGVDSYNEIMVAAIDSGDILSIDVDCDIGLTSTDDLDFLLMDSIQANSLPSSSWNWNPHASFEDTCSHSWEYETGKTSGWSLVIDNSDQARTDGLNNGVMVDVEIDIRNLIPLVEITDTSRMIDSGDYFRVDTGYLPANGVIDIDYSFWSHGTAMLTDDLDILVMESSEANEYENSNDAVVLGHTTILDAGSQSWSYQFPNAGTYSIIFDNTDEPSGGAGDGSDIQVEIGVTSLTIPSLFGNLWTGWHQSRHYADEGDIMALDLGTLNSGDDVYYYVDGKNEGGSIWSSKEFDILFMTKQNYDLYVNGSSFTAITDGTKYKEDGLIPAVENMSIASSSHYMLVLDAADGPDSNSADENGDWIWEFIVLSDGGSIVNLQAEDNHYEDAISVGSISTPDSDSDGVRNGLDECPSTPSGASVDSTGCDSSQLDSDGDGVANDSDQCPNTPAGDVVDSTGCTVQVDADNDGVPDSADLCPDTPSGESVDSNGCSSSQLDDDSDGITNNGDQCPNTPSGEMVGADGCSDSQTDADGDGIADDVDQCPNTPAGENVDSNGCTEVSDDDGDGVENSADQCPNTPTGETVDTDGCSDSQLDDDADGVANSDDLCSDTPLSESPDADGCSDSQTDADMDGVADDVDQCPNTPIGDNVDSNGCTEVSDDDGDGVDDNSDTFSNNTAPVVSNVVISPTAALQNDELTCNYDVYDADGDTIIVNVTWLVNGVVINIDWQSDTLSSAFNFEDEVECSVTASDGQQTSNAVSDSITILPASSFESNDDDELSALGAFGTMAAIVAGIFVSRRKDE